MEFLLLFVILRCRLIPNTNYNFLGQQQTLKKFYTKEMNYIGLPYIKCPLLRCAGVQNVLHNMTVFCGRGCVPKIELGVCELVNEHFSRISWLTVHCFIPNRAKTYLLFVSMLLRWTLIVDEGLSSRHATEGLWLMGANYQNGTSLILQDAFLTAGASPHFFACSNHILNP